MPSKSPDAFRTISEVAEWLNTPAHVLRFWESKFSQVKPVKRAGGRRYYRPADMALIGGIKKLLHDDGMTIKGVQKLLREQGIKHVAAMSQPLDEDLEHMVEPVQSTPTPVAEPADTGQVLDFQARPQPDPGDTPTADPHFATQTPPRPDAITHKEPEMPDLFAEVEEDGENLFAEDADTEIADAPLQDDRIDTMEAGPDEHLPQSPPAASDAEDSVPPAEQAADQPPDPPSDTPAGPSGDDTVQDAGNAALPTFLKKPPEPMAPVAPDADAGSIPPAASDRAPEAAPQMPQDDAPAREPEIETDPAVQDPAPGAPGAPDHADPDSVAADTEAAGAPLAETPSDRSPTPARPASVSVPPDPQDQDVPARHALLTRLAARPGMGQLDRAALGPLLDRLRAHEAKMTKASRD